MFFRTIYLGYPTDSNALDKEKAEFDADVKRIDSRIASNIAFGPPFHLYRYPVMNFMTFSLFTELRGFESFEPSAEFSCWTTGLFFKN